MPPIDPAAVDAAIERAESSQEWSGDRMRRDCELFAAAKRLLRDIDESFEYPPGVPYDSTPDLRIVCGAVLRAGREDDGEPITAQWAYQFGVMWLGWSYDKKNGKDIVAFIDKPNGETLEIRTRGEFRRLCAALGIPLAGE